MTSVSEEMVAYLRDSFHDPKAFCIPNGIDFDELSWVTENVSPSTPPGHFVYGGRLHPDKRVLLLVELFEECIRAGIEQNLYIIGDGEQRQALAEYIVRNGLEGRIFLLGSMDRHRALSEYARARCLVLTSAEEGCPNVVLEALALGVPVIAAAVGGVPELVRHDETGYLFPADRPRTAIEYILHLAGNEAVARDMWQRGARSVRQKFDLAVAAGKYMELYHAVLRGRTEYGSEAGKTTDV